MAQSPLKLAADAPASIHVLRVVLADIEPALWRDLAVQSDLTLAELHEVIQIAFGWHNGHLHQFIIHDPAAGKRGELYAADPVFDLGSGKNSHELVLAAVCPAAKATLRYQYDLGDDWMHEITVVSVGAPKAGAVYPACTDGDRNGPMEDCGGAPGHMELAAALANPDEADPEMLEWAEDYDPEVFNRQEINGVLKDWSSERRRQLADGILWRRSSLLWDLASFPKQHLAPKKAVEKAPKQAPEKASKKEPGAAKVAGKISGK